MTNPFVFWPLALEAAGSLLLFGSTVGLVRRPGALLAAVSTLTALSVFFVLGVLGSYRHEALWLAFLISLYWICWDTSPWEKVAAPTPRRASFILCAFGSVLFVCLLAIQAVGGVADIKDAIYGFVPSSRAADFAGLVGRVPYLKDATIIADPDYLVETLPYYIDNRTYLMRQQQYGNVVRFSKKAWLSLQLADILQIAQSIRATTGTPVIILLRQRLDEGAPPLIYYEGYNRTLITTPDQIRSFKSATGFLGRFEPATTDESFDAYLLQ